MTSPTRPIKAVFHLSKLEDSAQGFRSRYDSDIFLGDTTQPTRTPHPDDLDNFPRRHSVRAKERRAGRRSLSMRSAAAFAPVDGAASTAGSHNAGLQRNSSSDGDDQSLFELSKSSGSSSGAPAPSVASDSSVKAAVNAPMQAEGQRLQLEMRRQIMLHSQPNSNRGFTAASEQSFGPTIPQDRQEVSIQVTGAGFGDDPCREPWPNETAGSSADGARRSMNDSPRSGAAGGSDEVNHPPFDLAASMLPLVPSLPPGGAEIRLSVRGIVIHRTGDITSAGLPYVRASLQPGAHSIRRTGALPIVLPPRKNSSPTIHQEKFDQTAGLPAVEDSVKYGFGGERCGADTKQGIITLPLVSHVAGIMRDKRGAYTPPLMRLEVVAGRSLGRCEIALPEALRRPGKVFRNVLLPVWRKRAGSREQATRQSGHTLGRNTEGSLKGCLSIPYERTRVGEVAFDFGVVFAGEPSRSHQEMDNGTSELTPGIVSFQILGIRTKDAQGLKGKLSAVQLADIVGVGARLTLGGENTEISTLGTESHGNQGTEGGEWGCLSARQQLSGHGGESTLLSMNTELDILHLSLIRREEREGATSSNGGLGLKRKVPDQAESGARAALTIAVSIINDIFGGRPQWVAMEEEYVEVHDERKGERSGRTLGEKWREPGGAIRQLEVKLRISVGDTAPSHHHGYLRSTSAEVGLPTNDCFPRRMQWTSNTTNIEQKLESATKAELLPGAASFLDLSAWIRSLGINCARALTNVPSQDSSNYGAPLRHPQSNVRAPESVVRSEVTSPGPGVFEVEVLAIHGRGLGHWSSSSVAQDCEERGGIRAPPVRNPAPWWVRVTFANGGSGRGINGVSFVDSTPAGMSSLTRGQFWDGGAGIEADALHEEDLSEREWVVSWPHPDRVRAKFPVHWSVSQSSVPVASFEIFRGQTLVARSVLELPPIIKRPSEPLTILHPCLVVDLTTTEASDVPATSNSFERRIALDLRCSFEASRDFGGVRGNGQDLKIGNTQVVAPRAFRPRVAATQRRAGLLCIQVVSIQHLHLEAKLATPTRRRSVLFLLPNNHTESSCDDGRHNLESLNPNLVNGSGKPNTDEVHRRGACHQDLERGKSCERGEEGMSVLRVEGWRRCDVMVLVTLLRDDEDMTEKAKSGYLGEQNRDVPAGAERILGTAWLPVGAGVMERGHLEEGWYPLRDVHKDWAGTSKACDIRLRMHFVPGLQHPASTLSSDGSAGPKDAGHEDEGAFLTVLLEEGRRLTHPDMPAGPFELFAEMAVEFQLQRGRGGEPSSIVGDRDPREVETRTVRSKMAVGPLPLRDESLSQAGFASRSAAVQFGTGASPSWQHVFHIPLPVAIASGEGEPDPNLRGAGTAQVGYHASTALLSVAIKSASRRVTTRYSSPAPRSLLASSSSGYVPRPEERITERCLLVGMARIRLPSYAFRRGPAPDDGAPLRGWYAVKDEATGENRGKVRLSIFPASTSTCCARRDGNEHSSIGADTGDDGQDGRYGGTKEGHPRRRHSSSPATESRGPLHLSSRISTPPQGAGAHTCVGYTDGHACDSSTQSVETDEAVDALRRAGGCGGPQRLQGRGLLLVSIDDLAMRSFGTKIHGPPAALVGAVVSLRNRHQGGQRSEGRAHHLHKTSTDYASSGGGSSTRKRSLSSFEHDSPGFGAVVAMDQFEEQGEYTLLYVRAHIKTPNQRLSSPYHGEISLASCLSSAGTATQGKMDLTKVDVGKGAQDIRGPSKAKRSVSFGGRHDDDSSSTGAHITSFESDEGSRDTEGGARAGGCYSVNVTTTFVSHVRGMLRVFPSKLDLTPPSTPELERWRDLTLLRERTDPRSVGPIVPTDRVAGAATTTAFLRVRVLPAGPWGFSRTFPLKLPGPSDWGRNPSSAGTAPLPRGSVISLEVDTTRHVIARRRRPHTMSTLPPSSRAASLHYGCEIEIEPPLLEICLFNNGDGRPRPQSPSSMPPSFVPFCLLGCGTLALPSVLAAASTHAGINSRGIMRREVALFRPGSGERIASVALDLAFPPQQSDTKAKELPDAGPSRATSPTRSTGEHPKLMKVRNPEGDLYPHAEYLGNEMSDVSAAIWALKATFYRTDKDSAGLVRVRDILAAVAKARWPHHVSAPTAPFAGKSLSTTNISAAAGDTSPVEAGAGMLVNRLRDLGFGAGRQGENETSRDAVGGVGDLIQYIRDTLSSREFAGDNEFVPWEVWVALSELIICRDMTRFDRGGLTPAPAISSALVWQRAEEIRCADNNENVGPPRGVCGSQNQRVPGCHRSTPEGSTRCKQYGGNSNCEIAATTGRGQHPVASVSSKAAVIGRYSTGDLAETCAAGFNGEGFGDLSFSADENNSSEYPTSLEHQCASVDLGNSGGRDSSHRPSLAFEAVRRRPNSAPQTHSASKKRLQQTLATSRRSWLSRSRPQRKPRRGQGTGSGKSLGIGRPSTSSPDRNEVVSSGAAQLGRPSDPSSGRHEVVYLAAAGPEKEADKNLRQRPIVIRGGADEHSLTSSSRQRPASAPSSEGDGLLRPEQWDRPTLDPPAWTGALQALVGGRVGDFDRWGECASHLEKVQEAGRLELENGRLRMETASAKRKAAQYQACMLESQATLASEHQRVRTLENRVLEAEGLLLQRERAKIREAARERARLLQLKVENARRREWRDTKIARARIKAAAATKLQRIAKGLLQRCRYKAELESVRALQRGGRVMLQARRAHHYRASRSLAASKLQRTWRGRSTRKRLELREVRVTLVQAIVRGHMQRWRIYGELQAHMRFRHEAATAMQKNRRRLVERRAYLVLRWASVKVQSNRRRCYARRELAERKAAVWVLQRAGRNFVFNVSRKKAAHLLQDAYRLSIRIKRCRRERETISTAARFLQQAVRAWVARRIVQRKRAHQRRARAAAIVMRALWRHLCRRKEHRRMVAAELTLLNFMAAFSVKLSRRRQEREASAAFRIQAAFRRSRFRARTSVLRNERRRCAAAALRIQAIARGRRSRVRSAALRSRRQLEQDATSKIQAAFRCHLSRARTLSSQEEGRRYEAAMGIQALFRGYKARAARTKRPAGVVKIQDFLPQRSQVAKSISPRELDRSILALQRLWRRSRRRANPNRVQDSPVVMGSIAELDERESSPMTPTSLESRASLTCSSVQEAIKALANGMSSRGVLTATDSNHLREALDLGGDDPVLQTALRQRLSGLQRALSRSSGVAHDPVNESVDGRCLENALRQSLVVLEGGLLGHYTDAERSSVCGF